MSWLIGHASDVGLVAAKAALMYLTALLALRLGERRTLAQWTIIDFATAVAMGAIIGRTAMSQAIAAADAKATARAIQPTTIQAVEPTCVMPIALPRARGPDRRPLVD